MDKDIFLLLYSMYVRTHLELCVQAWARFYQKDSKVLKKVQRRATKLVCNIRNWSYQKRFKYLDLNSLERRKRGDLIEAFKILNSIKKRM